MGKETIKNRYPIYNEGKLLTSSNLNDSFDFLHSHLKFTRKLLFGQGIVRGLEYSYDSKEGTITIYEGTAITEQGSIIEITKPGTYYCYETTNLQHIKDKRIEYVLFEKDKEVNAERKDISQIEGIDNYFLGLLLYYNKTEGILCSDQSCIVENDEVKIEIIPFLTQKPYINEILNPTEVTLIPEIEAPVFKNITNYNILPVFLRKVTNLFHEKIASIAKGLENINKSKGIKEINEIISLGTSDIFGRVIDLIKKIEFDNRDIPTYLSFTDDIIEAVNEFVVSCNRFLYRYRINAGTKFEETVILGKIQTIDDSRSTLKETYQDFGKISHQNIIVRLYKRIGLMVDCFVDFTKNKIKPDKLIILPSSSKFKLGERSIPFYYTQSAYFTNALIEYWDAHNEQHTQSQSLYSTDINNKLNKSDFRKADIYKLSGYGNTNIVEELTDQIYNYNLPTFVIQQEIYGDTLSFFLEEYKAMDQNNTLSNKNIEETISFIRFQEGILPADENKLKRILEKILKNHYESYHIDKAAEILDSITKESEIEEIWQSIYIAIQDSKKRETNTLEEYHRKLLAFIMIAILYHRIGSKEFKPYNTLGIDYIGGVEKKDILLMITHHSQTLLCLNMPYTYYLINQENYKDKIINIKREVNDDLKNAFNPENFPEAKP